MLANEITDHNHTRVRIYCGVTPPTLLLKRTSEIAPDNGRGNEAWSNEMAEINGWSEFFEEVIRLAAGAERQFGIANLVSERAKRASSVPVHVN